jgi:diacylglycerol O-acyltransferase / wax synthase
MKQLTGLDATFLYLEKPEMPMHVGALHVFELPPGARGKFVVALRKHVASRLPITPVLRRRLWWMPLNMANPAWVDADPDLRLHIVEEKLPPSAVLGNGMAELEAAVGRLHPVLLDRSRPLWKFHVFEGLAPTPDGRRRVALYTQLHHAAVDGQAAVALANALMDVSAAPRAMELRASRRTKTFRLDMTEMLRGVLGSQAQKVAGIIRELPSTVGTLKDAAVGVAGRSAWLNGKAGGKGGTSNLTLAPRTPLNASVGTGRAFATASLPLAELKALGRAHGATVNDMVLMLCSTALRRHYARQRLLPRKSMVAAVPISLRQAGDDTPDNQASMSLVNLGTNIADTRKRLAHVQAATGAMKSTMGSLKSILPTDFPSLGVPWLMEAATALYGKAKVAERIPQVANLVISNVPGPAVPLYMAGARMLSNHPSSIIVHGLALNITVQSYDHSLDFGLMADAQALPDVRDLAQALYVAFDDLRALPRPGEFDPDAEPASGSRLKRTGQRLGGVVTGAVTGAVSGAVSRVAQQMVGAAVSGVMKGAVKGAQNSRSKGSGTSTSKSTSMRTSKRKAAPPAPAPAAGRPKPTKRPSR